MISVDENDTDRINNKRKQNYRRNTFEFERMNDKIKFKKNQSNTNENCSVGQKQQQPRKKILLKIRRIC